MAPAGTSFLHLCSIRIEVLKGCPGDSARHYGDCIGASHEWEGCCTSGFKFCGRFGDVWYYPYRILSTITTCSLLYYGSFNSLFH